MREFKTKIDNQNYHVTAKNKKDAKIIFDNIHNTDCKVYLVKPMDYDAKFIKIKKNKRYFGNKRFCKKYNCNTLQWRSFTIPVNNVSDFVAKVNEYANKLLKSYEK